MSFFLMASLSASENGMTLHQSTQPTVCDTEPSPFGSLTTIPNRYILAGMAKVQLWGYQCDRCGHEWLPREKDQDPHVCPKCKSPYWDTPRKMVAQQSFGAVSAKGKAVKKLT